MATKPILAHQPDIYTKMFLSHSFVDHFNAGFDVVENWAVTADVGETQDVVAGAANGHVSIACDGDDNDEAYVLHTATPILLAANTTVEAAFCFKYTEANTDDANVIIGLNSAGGANSLVDNGGGPAASYSGALIYKVDGGTTWNVEVSHGASQDTKATALTAGGQWERLLIRINCADLAAAEVTLWHGTGATGTFDPIYESGAHTITPPIKIIKDFSTPVAMGLMFGVKAGGANTETLLVDYAGYTMTSV